MSSASRPEKPGLLRSIPSFVLGTFTRNLAAKIAALVLAILVWYTVRLDLTATETFQAAVRVELAPGLMQISQPPLLVQVEIEGPRSRIAVLKQQDRVEIRLKVGLDDLAGQLAAMPRFSPARGNLEHGYGTDLRIVGMSPAEIELSVAVRAEAEAEVNPPQMDLTNRQWSVELFDLVTTRVRLVGPKAVIDETAALTPIPIEADPIVARARPDEEIYGPIERPLQLPPALRDRGVTLAPGQDQEFRYRATFVRSRTPEQFPVPFVVYYERTDAPVVLDVGGADTLRKTETGFTLTIEFKGTPSALGRLRESIAEGRVRAYVRAEEFRPYAEAQVGAQGPPSAIHLALPEEFWGRVTPTSPNPRDITLRVEAK